VAIDPVCGMQVDESRAAGKSVYKGLTYYFCSTHCKEAFDNEPENYLQRSKAASDRGHDHGHGDHGHMIPQKHKGHEHSHVDHSMHMGHGSHGHGGHEHHAMMVEDFKKRFWVSLVATIPILLFSHMIQMFLGLESLQFSGDLVVVFVVSTFVFFYGGWPFHTGLVDELRAKQPGMMTLIGLAITVAYVYSSAVVFGLKGETFFWELATLIDIMLLGHWIEMRSVMGASRALEELARLMPSEAHVVQPDGTIKDVPLEQLKHGDKVLIKPGEKIPADGTVIKGESSVNEALLTGESKPLDKKTGDRVIGGAINGEGAITVEMEKTGRETYLSKVIELVRQVQESRSKTQDLANRAAVWLTGISITAGAITLAVWASAGEPFAFAIERTVTVMVITCPHALGLAIPLVVAVSTAISARNGLLIRNRVAFERARNLQAIIFDKTGTLTEGQLGVTDIIVFDQTISEKDLLILAASVESRSEHFIARGILAAAKQRAISFPEPQGFKSIPGKGAEAVVDGRMISIVSPGYLAENHIGVSGKEVNELSAQGKTVVFVLSDQKPLGVVALADIIRSESRDAVSQLNAMGIKCMMLTGDNKQTAQWVAKELGLDDYFAEILPHQKSEKVKEIQKRGFTVGMVGDGVNDAPALAVADVGIAIGAGTDVAIETADIILVRSDPRDVVGIVKLARATYGKMVQNLWWATGYNALAIPLAAGVLYSLGILLSPALGAVLMSLSTVIVAINARLLKVDK
jgi:Cu2+-exporting ATPase